MELFEFAAPCYGGLPSRTSLAVSATEIDALSL
jgi:hypothetical protein